MGNCKGVVSCGLCVRVRVNWWMQKAPSFREKRGSFLKRAGDDVLSHPVAQAVPSAQRGLTTVFGMGTGVALAQ